MCIRDRARTVPRCTLRRMARAAVAPALLLLATCCPKPAPDQTTPQPPVATIDAAPAVPPGPPARDLAVAGEIHLKSVRQLTFGGENAVAYWSFGGDRLT